jgi:hypothetical protein
MGQSAAFRKHSVGQGQRDQRQSDSRPGDGARLINSGGFDKAMQRSIQRLLTVSAALVRQKGI